MSRGRGRRANAPWQLPLAGWRDALLRLLFWRMTPAWSVSAAGVAFFATLALFPGLVAVASVYGLVFELEDMLRHVEGLRAIAPPDVVEVLAGRVEALEAQGSGTLGVGLAVAVLSALWGASRGTRAMMEGLNLVYGEVERRNPVRKGLLGLALSTLSALLVVAALALSAGIPAVMGLLGIDDLPGLGPVRWLVLATLILAVSALQFRLAPCRSHPRWVWVLPGALSTTVGLLLGSWAFAAWSTRFADLEATYGALGTVAVLMLWLYLGAYVVLLSGGLNAELERQTEQDTTSGPPAPAGERGAWAADSLGLRPARLRNLVLRRGPLALDDEGRAGPSPEPPPAEVDGRRVEHR